MFKISPIQDKEAQKKFAELSGTEYIEDSFGYAMINQDNGELMGMSQFDIKDGRGYIYTLRSKIGYSDFEAMFILGRATMNFIDLCGVHTCHAAIDAAEERLIKSIGFKFSEENGSYIADMTGMFDGKCDGHTVDLK